MTDPISIVSIVFGAPNFAKSAGELIGLIESTDSKLDKLIESEYATGIDLIVQAQNSSVRKDELLAQAIPVLTRAKALEQGYRKALAMLGLSFCHHHLKDYTNAKKTLWDIRKIEIPTSDEYIAFAKDGALAVLAPPGPARFLIQKVSGNKETYLELLQNEKNMLGVLIDSIETYIENEFLNTQ